MSNIYPRHEDLLREHNYLTEQIRINSKTLIGLQRKREESYRTILYVLDDAVKQGNRLRERNSELEILLAERERELLQETTIVNYPFEKSEKQRTLSTSRPRPLTREEQLSGIQDLKKEVKDKRYEVTELKDYLERHEDELIDLVHGLEIQWGNRHAEERRAKRKVEEKIRVEQSEKIEQLHKNERRRFCKLAVPKSENKNSPHQNKNQSEENTTASANGGCQRI